MQTFWIIIHTLSFFQFPDVPVQSSAWGTQTFLNKEECETFLSTDLFEKELKKDTTWKIQTDKTSQVLIKRSNATQSVARCVKVNIDLINKN